MAKGTSRPSDAVEAAVSDEDFAALLQKEFLPANERQETDAKLAIQASVEQADAPAEQLSQKLAKALGLKWQADGEENDLPSILRKIAGSDGDPSDIIKSLTPEEKLLVAIFGPNTRTLEKSGDIDPDKDSLSPKAEVELLSPAISAALSKLGVLDIDAKELAQLVATDLSRRQITVVQRQAVSVESPPLPTEAPEKYQGLRGPETPPAFVQRVYGEWLGHGLTRAHVRKLDAKLYEGINNWLSRPGNQWPAEVDLPTLKEQNDRDWAAMNAPENRELLGKFTGKEAARIGAAVSRRTKQ